MYLDASDVANGLQYEASKHGAAIAPDLEPDPQTDLSHESKAKDGDEEDVATEVGDIFNVSQAKWACLQSAKIGVVGQRHVESLR